MIFRTPKYYENFQCIADKCIDSCCTAGWEIDIDKQTEEVYKNVIKGEFGDKLRRNISNTSPCHFILDENQVCPFFNDKKLCDIYTELGENNLCQICKDHPRFYEWFEFAGVKEAGIGLCCEEAARIIISENEPFSIIESTIDDSDIIRKTDENTESDIVLYNYLEKVRKTIIDYLNSDENNIDNKLKNVLWYSFMIQQNIDNNLLDDEEIFEVNSNIKTDVKPIITYMSTLEPNDLSWPGYLKECVKTVDSCENIEEKLEEFKAKNPEIDKYLNNIAIYFIWRYFLKGVFDGDILSEVKLMYVSCNVIKYLLFCKWLENNKLTFEDCIEIVKKYSEEVEYSEDNLMQFANDSYDLDFFEINNLLAL